MRRLPPLITLRSFEAAARHLSFRLAADELGVTPTAISHQIHLLEEYCGQSLFRRRPRPMVLTRAGEQLFPTLRDGFNRFAEVFALLDPARASLRVTTTSAFAARWLLPKLPLWTKTHAGVPLNIISTYDVLDLSSGAADVAIRYARTDPTDGESIELFRDRFHVVGSPALVGTGANLLLPAEIAQFPLIETGWPPNDTEAPTWSRWANEAGVLYSGAFRLTNSVSLRFEEELHAIDAAVAGQGLAICSDVLTAGELASGGLRTLSEVTLPGYGFYLVYRQPHAKQASIRAFANWARSMASVS